jgi:hypothetical protein
MNEQKDIKKETIKDKVIADFLENKKYAESLGVNYFPSGLLKYYLFKGRFSTYAGRIVYKYCKENKIDIVRASELGVNNWEDCPVNGNMRVFLFKK